MKYITIITITLALFSQRAAAQAQNETRRGSRSEINFYPVGDADRLSMNTAVATVLKEEIKVYPTQCVNTLTVDNSKNNYLNYRILNYDGREVSNGMLRPQGTSRINVSGYPAGTYLLFITGAGDSGAFRFLKM